MNEALYNLIKSVNLTLPAHERWAIYGSGGKAYQALWPAATVVDWPDPLEGVDGLLLIEALSQAGVGLAAWEPLFDRLPQGGQFIVADWRADGPLHQGPPLEQRVKQGWLCRRLRQLGFGRIERLLNHDLYYLVRAIKVPAPVSPHAGEFVEVAHVDDLPRNKMKLVALFGHRLIVANTGRDIVAFAQACPHAEGGDLFRGRLRGRNILCPLHFYIWNVSTGDPVEPVDEDILPRYPVKIDEAGRIFVALAPLSG